MWHYRFASNLLGNKLIKMLYNLHKLSYLQCYVYILLSTSDKINVALTTFVCYMLKRALTLSTVTQTLLPTQQSCVRSLGG
jgi:hypothetical protein